VDVIAEYLVRDWPESDATAGAVVDDPEANWQKSLALEGWEVVAMLTVGSKHRYWFARTTPAQTRATG
jgi:hypothetical protein